MGKVVQYFGLHKDEDDLLWLVQKNNNISGVGLPPDLCPFVPRHSSLQCPHSFDFSDTDQTLFEIYKKYAEQSELLRLLGPEPQDDRSIIYIETSNSSHYMVITDLLQLWCPVVTCSSHRAQYKGLTSHFQRTERLLFNTNLSRYFIYGITEADAKFCEIIGQTFFNTQGRLFMAGERVPVYGMDRVMRKLPFDPLLIEFINELKDVKDIRKIGATALKNYMRS